MTALKAHEVERFVKNPDLKHGAFLVYGPDAGLVHEIATSVIRHFSGEAPDPLSHTVLEAQELEADPSRLAVEARTASLFGGARTIRVRGADRRLSATLSELLSAPPEAVIVLEAGNLQRNDPLRALAEANPAVRALPCYADGEKTLDAVVRGALESAGIAAEPGVVPAITRLLGNDREVTRRELEKLVLFAETTHRLTLADVAALCGDNSIQALDAIVDAAGGGHVSALDAALADALTLGSDAQRILSVTLSHFAWLRRLRAEVDAGKSPRDVLQSARPRPHFARTPALEGQLRLWNDESLSAAAARLYEAIAQSRRMGTLAPDIARRALFAICMSAARH